MPEIDILIPRVGSSTNEKIAYIIEAFIYNGAKSINNGTQILTMKNKNKMAMKLSAWGIPTIKTMVIYSKKQIDVIEKNFNFPVILKTNSGSLGQGVYKIKDEHELKQMINHSLLLDRNLTFLIQEFIDYQQGEDIRIFMFCGKIIGAMKRISSDQDFKANYSIHKNVQQIEVDEKIRKICDAIYKNFKSDSMGIDLLQTKDGYVVCEINSAPGFEGMEEANPGLNVAKEIFKMLKKV